MKAFWSRVGLLLAVFTIIPVLASGRTNQTAENNQTTSSSSPQTIARQATNPTQTSAPGATAPQATASPQEAPPVTEPELVRLSYVQGDVTFNRGNGKTPDLKKPWEQAQINLPIDQGQSVATGDNGRAEVEFETSGVVYLAENSVLLFKQLTSTGGVPSTQIELISGTLTTNIRPIPGEFFVIQMPDGQYQIAYGELSYMRIDSYLDGMAFTPQIAGAYYYKQGAGPRVTLEKGQTVVWESGEPMRIEGAGQSVAPNGFDDWVAGRYAAREQSMAPALKASGLTSAIPGLTDLYAGGTFFACAPYGACWEPSRESSGAAQPVAGPSAQPPPQPAAEAGEGMMDAKQAPQEQATGGVARPQASAQGAGFVPQAVDFDAMVGGCPFPLWDDWTVVAKTPAQFADLSYQAYLRQAEQPWFWPVCHYASWIYHDGHYVVVVRGKPRRRRVWWVKVGNQVALVPPHPRDKTGLPPRNLRHGALIPLADGKNGKIVLASYNPSEKVEMLSSPPKQFRNVSPPALTSVPAPVIIGRMLEEPAGLKNATTKAAEPQITYNYEKGQFMEAGREVGGRTKKPTAIRSLSARGGFTPAGGGYSGNSHASSADRRSAGSSRSYGGGGAGRSYGGGGGASHSFSGGSGGHSSGGGGASGGGAGSGHK